MSAEQPTGDLFQWKCVVLDDNAGDHAVSATVDELRRVGLECEAFGNDTHDRGYGLAVLANEQFERLERADFVFVDMKWKTSGCFPDGLLISPNRRFDQGAFSGWVDILLHQHAAGPIRVQETEIGFWIAAAVSHVNPDAAVILYSSNPSVALQSVPAALGSFYAAPYAIAVKSPSGAIQLKPFFDNLSTLQRRLLTENGELRRWVVGKVILRHLLGLQPEPAHVSVRSNPELVTVAGFFPQTRAKWEPTEWIGEMTKLLAIPMHALTPPQKRALAGVQHALKALKPESTPDEATIAGLRVRCADVGAPGSRIAGLLHQSREDYVRWLRDVWSAVHEAELNAVDQLLDYARTHQSATSSGFFDRLGKCPLAFDLVHFRRVVDALRDNAVKYGGSRSGYRLTVKFECGELVIEYLDDSDGFADLPELGRAVEESLGSSMSQDRGLPMILSFGLFYPLRKLAVLVGTGWETLHPARATTPPANAWKFGIEWRFPQAPRK